MKAADTKAAPVLRPSVLLGSLEERKSINVSQSALQAQSEDVLCGNYRTYLSVGLTWSLPHSSFRGVPSTPCDRMNNKTPLIEPSMHFFRKQGVGCFPKMF